MTAINANIVEATYLPRIVSLSPNHYALVFSLMKLLPAKAIIEKAIDEGLIDKDTHIIESSSGTFAKGLAMVCNLKGLKLSIVSDNAIDASFKIQLEGLGANIEIVESVEGKSIQFLRLERLEQLRKKYPNHYWTRQYDNPWNREAYCEVADKIIQMFDRVDYLVGTVGSGGSMSGVAGFLQQRYQNLKSVAVDTHGSTLFGQPDGKRVLRGLGNSLIPGNLQHHLFDEIHWVTAAQAFFYTRELHRQHSIFSGPTSGASYMIGNWLNTVHPDKIVLSIFPDEGWRYADIFNTDFLRHNDLYLGRPPQGPVKVTHPHRADASTWTSMDWGRMSLAALSLDNVKLTA